MMCINVHIVDWYVYGYIYTHYHASPWGGMMIFFPQKRWIQLRSPQPPWFLLMPRLAIQAPVFEETDGAGLDFGGSKKKQKIWWDHSIVQGLDSLDAGGVICFYLLVIEQLAKWKIAHLLRWFMMIHLFRIVIVHSYVKLPQGTYLKNKVPAKQPWLFLADHQMIGWTLVYSVKSHVLMVVSIPIQYHKSFNILEYFHILG